MITARYKLGIVLFNLGGPDRPESIKPFLLNLFRDPAILRVPPFIRPFLARWIARFRLAQAMENYALLGGRSPLLELTYIQAQALEISLGEYDTRCVIAMRYWHPMSEAAARDMLAWGPDEILLLPLYPQYSTTTTGSSLTAWREAAARIGLVVQTRNLCCYFADDGYAVAAATQVSTAYDAARAELLTEIPLRVLFSAHGLPETIIARGDPYQYQIKESVAAVLRHWDRKIDHRICYQSRATPQKWLCPSTEDEIGRAADDRVAILIVPISFVSDHSETLVELDVEYRHLAEKLGVPGYFRAPVANDAAAFISALAGLVRRSLAGGPGLRSFAGGGACPADHGLCPHHLAASPV